VNSFWADGDSKWALRAFFEEGPVGFLRVLVGVGIDELHIARAKNLEPVMEVPTWGQRLGAETGAWIINLEKEQWLAGVIAYSGFDIGRVAAT